MQWNFSMAPSDFSCSFKLLKLLGNGGMGVGRWWCSNYSKMLSWEETVIARTIVLWLGITSQESKINYLFSVFLLNSQECSIIGTPFLYFSDLLLAVVSVNFLLPLLKIYLIIMNITHGVFQERHYQQNPKIQLLSHLWGLAETIDTLILFSELFKKIVLYSFSSNFWDS